MVWIFQTLSWLLPNHNFPWTSSWQDGLAAISFAILLTMAALRMKNPRPRIPRLALLIAVLALVPMLQWLSGRIHFSGDAWLASLYLLGFALALALPGLQAAAIHELLGGLAWAVLLAALASVGLALCQWLGVEGLGIFLMDLPPGGRPYANLAQPNQLATLLMLGLVAAGGLHQQRRLSGPVLAGVVAVLAFGVVMTQSRAGWLEMAGLLLWLLLWRERASLRLPRAALLALGLYFVALVLVWPGLNEALYLMVEQRAGPAAQLDGNLRWQHWRSLLDALGREPWWGYGWNQVAVAQMRVASDHPFVGEMIEHSHNLLLDLLVWNGIPLGLLLVLGLAYWFWSHLRACREANVAWLLAGIGMLMTHALFEFPLEYAYFLLPLGMMMGAIEQLSPAGRRLAVPRGLVRAVAGLAVGLLVWTIAEYVRVEEHYRQLRFELAGFGKAPDQGQLDVVVLLTQLREFQQFARSQAQRDMAPAELDGMRRVAERYAYPPVLFRYALALALNGKADESARVLTVLCRIHLPARCEEGREAWRAMGRDTYPELEKVPLPAMPAVTAR